MTQRTGDGHRPEVRALARVIPLHTALRHATPHEDTPDAGTAAVLPGPWEWFTHRDIPPAGGPR